MKAGGFCSSIGLPTCRGTAEVRSRTTHSRLIHCARRGATTSGSKGRWPGHCKNARVLSTTTRQRRAFEVARYFLRYRYSANSKSPLETSSPGASMNLSLPPIHTSASTGDGRTSPQEIQRGVSRRIPAILRRTCCRAAGCIEFCSASAELLSARCELHAGRRGIRPRADLHAPNPQSSHATLK